MTCTCRSFVCTPFVFLVMSDGEETKNWRRPRTGECPCGQNVFLSKLIFATIEVERQHRQMAYLCIHSREHLQHKLFMVIFSTLRNIKLNSGRSFRRTIVAGFVHKFFALVWCGFHGAAPIPYLQTASLNLPHPCLRKATMLLQNSVIFLRCRLVGGRRVVTWNSIICQSCCSHKCSPMVTFRVICRVRSWTCGCVCVCMCVCSLCIFLECYQCICSVVEVRQWHEDRQHSLWLAQWNSMASFVWAQAP